MDTLSRALCWQVWDIITNEELSYLAVGGMRERQIEKEKESGK